MDWQQHVLFRPLAIAVIIIAAVYLQSRIRGLITNLTERHHFPSNLSIAIRAASRWILIVAGAMVILAVLGVQIGNLWTLFSAVLAMVAVGFVAVWSMLSNILAFFVLLIWHHWHLGDRITLLPENLEGEVQDMNLMFTVLRTAEGDSLTIPNNLLLQRVVRVRRQKA